MTSREQGTTGAYDAATRTGWLFLDDGTRIPFGSAALEGGPRLLRPGQRVTVERDAAGTVVAVRLLGLP